MGATGKGLGTVVLPGPYLGGGRSLQPHPPTPPGGLGGPSELTLALGKVWLTFPEVGTQRSLHRVTRILSGGPALTPELTGLRGGLPASHLHWGGPQEQKSDPAQALGPGGLSGSR